MKVLLVEDSTYRIDDFKILAKARKWDLCIAKTYQKAILFLILFKFETIYLDHDLASDKTGYDVAKFIKKHNIKSSIYIHSQNVVGAENINRILPYAERVPFHLIRERI